MTAKNRVRRGRCQDNLRDFNQRNRENAICGYEIAWKGANLIKISWVLQNAETVGHSHGDILQEHRLLDLCLELLAQLQLK